VAVSPTRKFSVAERSATLVDPLVGPEVAVTAPVVSSPAMLAWAAVTGEVPGKVACPSGPAEIWPVACAALALLGDAAAAGNSPHH
jgi:hypothetical protein